MQEENTTLDRIVDNINSREILIEPMYKQTIIMCAIQIDKLLTLLLKNQMRPIKRIEKDYLFKVGGPLSSTFSKLYLAYQLKLIDKEFFQVISKVLEVRNRMAHNIEELSETSDLLHEIDEILTINHLYSAYRDAIPYGDDFQIVNAVSMYITIFYEYYMRDPKNVSEDGLLKINLKIFKDIPVENVEEIKRDFIYLSFNVAKKAFLPYSQLPVDEDR